MGDSSTKRFFTIAYFVAYVMATAADVQYLTTIAPSCVDFSAVRAMEKTSCITPSSSVCLFKCFKTKKGRMTTYTLIHGLHLYVR